MVWYSEKNIKCSCKLEYRTIDSYIGLMKGSSYSKKVPERRYLPWRRCSGFKLRGTVLAENFKFLSVINSKERYFLYDSPKFLNTVLKDGHHGHLVHIPI